jgi:Holliday junction resolvase
VKVFIAHPASEEKLVGRLVQDLADHGCEVTRPASTSSSMGELLSAISAAIRTADVVIAIASSSNPNVFYELGLAVGSNVPTLVVARAGDGLPADVTSVPFVQLTGDIDCDADEIVRRAIELAQPEPAPEPELGSAYELLAAAAREPGKLDSLSPAAFEGLVARLLAERGFQVTRDPSASDWGADLKIEADGRTMIVEVKKYGRQSRVSVEAVRQVLGMLGDTDGALGAIISSSDFTAAARALAEQTRVSLLTIEDLLADASIWEKLEI